jgi:DNA modification methylase
VLRDDGTLWVNLGDSYFGDSPCRSSSQEGLVKNGTRMIHAEKVGARRSAAACEGLKRKSLIGIPWRVAFALQDAGWYLRSDIIWAKKNCMPESVTDRPTKAHEYIFLMTKQPKYYYDAEAISEPVSELMMQQVRDGYEGEATKDFFGNGVQDASGTKSRIIEGARKKLAKEGVNSRMYVSRDPAQEREFNGKHRTEFENRNAIDEVVLTRNKRTVWHVATAPFKEAHFATFPPDLIRPCILAGCPAGGTVLDPFGGSGTTALVATEHGRNATIVELNPKYVQIAQSRTNVTKGLAL